MLIFPINMALIIAFRPCCSAVRVEFRPRGSRSRCVLAWLGQQHVVVALAVGPVGVDPSMPSLDSFKKYVYRRVSLSYVVLGPAVARI